TRLLGITSGSITPSKMQTLQCPNDIQRRRHSERACCTGRKSDKCSGLAAKQRSNRRRCRSKYCPEAGRDSGSCELPLGIEGTLLAVMAELNAGHIKRDGRLALSSFHHLMG